MKIHVQEQQLAGRLLNCLAKQALKFYRKRVKPFLSTSFDGFDLDTLKAAHVVLRTPSSLGHWWYFSKGVKNQNK